jgi:hypothetical protein
LEVSALSRCSRVQHWLTPAASASGFLERSAASRPRQVFPDGPIPQIGFIFPVSEGYQGYVNLKGYRDLEVENRAQGWTAWVTFAISPAPPEPASAKPIARKY